VSRTIDLRGRAPQKPPLLPTPPPGSVPSLLSALPPVQLVSGQPPLLEGTRLDAAGRPLNAPAADLSAWLVGTPPTQATAEFTAPPLGLTRPWEQAPDYPRPSAALAPAPPVANLVPPPLPVAPPASEPLPETGAAGGPVTCPHCEWPLDRTDPTKPEPGEVVAFLQAQLGQLPYVREYTLFDGALRIVFRTLTVGEIDLVYRQAYRELERGVLTTMPDFYERLGRLRLCLQLLKLSAPSVQRDLPEGLSPETNPHARGFWQTAAPEPGETQLPQIEAYLLADVLRTEPIFRVVNNACARFNRAVAKLEALADTPGFWQPTGSAT